MAPNLRKVLNIQYGRWSFFSASLCKQFYGSRQSYFNLFLLIMNFNKYLFASFIFMVFKCVLGKKLKVGIVGGGIGGSSAAYYLKQLLEDKVEVTLFESGKIGGRLSTCKIGNQRFETGGSIYISRNQYISNLVQSLGLKTRKNDVTGYSALYDGQKAVFAESNWMPVTIAQLAWRYGFGIYYLNTQIRQMLDRFDRIYSLQTTFNGFENVTLLLKAMDESFPDLMLTPTGYGLEKDGFSKPIIDELVAATLRVNYGQFLDVHKFVGSVSVAGVGGTLFAVEGGNERVPQRLLEESKAKVIHQRVATIERKGNGKFIVSPSARSDIPPEDHKPFEFDAVIIAAPQTDDMPNRIQFKGLSEQPVFQGRYHRTVTTILRGELRHEQFEGIHPYTDEILTVKPGGLFNSISKIYPVDSDSSMNRSDVWKVFSQRPLTSSELSFLFDNPKEVTVVDWLAYPSYGTEARADKFVIAPGLFHINAIEWAASAMEMSLIGAHNVALLIRNEWCATHECLQIKTPPPPKEL